MTAKLLEAARNADWMQVVYNQGPPCFHLDDGRFCLRAERWDGHKTIGGSGPIHEYVSLESLLRSICGKLHKNEARLHWLHDCSTGQTDPEGYEWGIYRVKWENGQAVSVMQTNSDLSDLDAEMSRELIHWRTYVGSDKANERKTCQ